MGVDQAVLLGRSVLEEVVILAGPILLVAMAVSLVVNVAQVLTSIQDTTIASVTRLLATGSALFFSMPWMWRHLTHLTLSMFSNFNVYLQ
jgi:flagellar biosynthesis protein FliQ